MSEYDRLGKLAKELRVKYPPGTRLELIHMEDEFAPVEDGMRGTVHFIDDMAQIHMLWDNKRTLPINVDTDSFRALTPEECYDEKCSEKEERFYDALNKGIVHFSENFFYIVKISLFICISKVTPRNIRKYIFV